MPSSSSASSHLGVPDNQKRWLVAGIALNKILIPQIRPIVEQEVDKEYNNLKTSHNIHTQSTPGRLQRWPAPRGKFLKYENINRNDAHPKLAGGRYDYPRFDCRVLSHVDFARLYMENYMAKFNAFDDHCDASAVLLLLGGVPVFSAAVQAAAGDVKTARNDWAHCVFSKWDPTKFQQSFTEMEHLVKVMALPAANERKLLGELKDWETKGTHLCMNSPVDPDLLQLVQQEVNSLQDAVENMSEEEEKEKTKVRDELQKFWIALEDMIQKVERLEISHQNLQDHTELIEIRVDGVEDSITDLKASDQVTKERVENLKDEMKELRKTSDELLKRENSGSTILLAEPYLPPNDQNFTGRNRESTEIVSALTSGSTRIVSIYGPPAFGKSEVTKAVGHDLKSKGNAVYRIELDEVYTEDDLRSTFLRFLSDEPRGNLKPVDFLLRQFSKIKDPVYFILDNADNLLESNVKDGVINLIKDILTNSPSVKILVATRESSEFSKLEELGQKVVRIGSLNDSSSHNLVQKLLPEVCEADCRKIAQFCGNMPFAIRLLCNSLPQHEMPLGQAIDNFVSSGDNVFPSLDNPDELNNSRLRCILDSSYQRLSSQNKKDFLSLSVIPGTFKVDVVADVWGIPISDAKWTLKRLHRKALIDSGSQPGSYKVHKILRLFLKQKVEQETSNGLLYKFFQFFARLIGKQDINELLVNSKIRFYNYYISLFFKLNERFLLGQSMSAFNDFHEEKQNIILSLINGCSDRSTRDRVFDALIHGVLFLDTSLWSDWASFDKIYDTAIKEVKQHGNNNTYTQLVLVRTFCEVTWRKEEVETMQLFYSIKEIQACRSDEEKGMRSSFLGIHKLANGQVEDGVAQLENCLSYSSETIDPFLRVLKIIILQILSLYYESNSDVNRAVECYKKASKECELAVGNRSLLVCPKMTSTGVSTTDKKIAKGENRPLVLEVYFHIAKTAKVFCHMETMKLFKYDVLQMRKENDANLFTNSKIGSFHLHRSIVGVLAEMTGYDEAIKSIQAMINALHKRTDCGEKFSEQESELDSISKDLTLVDDVKHKEALAKSYSYLAVLQFRTKDYEASLQSQRCALDIRRDLHILDERHPDIADSYHQLAMIQRILGDCKSALHHHQIALDIRIQLSKTSPLKEFLLKRAASHHELGVTQCKMEDFSSAFRSHESALQIRLENLGDQHRDTACSYHELGITQWYLQEYECALDSHKKALMIALDVFGKDYSVTADSHHEIGKTRFCLERYREALRSHLDAFHTRLEVLGEKHSDTANSCYEIGATQFEMGWYLSALQYHTRALNTRQALTTETQQADVAQSLYQVGRTHCQIGNYEEAVNSLNRALSIRKRLLGEQHTETADVYYELGKVFFHKEDYTSALKLHQRALEIRHLKLDKKHAMVADSLFQIGLAQWKLGEYELSLKAHQRALEIRLERFGTKHAETAESYYQLGLVLSDLDLYIEALDSHQQALNIRREWFGYLHTATANSCLETGNAQIKVREFNSAFRSFEDALQIRAELVAIEDKEMADLPHDWKVEKSLLQAYKLPLQLYQRVLTVTVEYSSSLQSQNDSLRQRLSNLKQQLIKKANCYQDVGNEEFIQELHDLDVVLHVCQRALHLRGTLLGEKHEDTASTCSLIGQVQYEMMDYTAALQSHQRALAIRLEIFGDNYPDTASSYNTVGVIQHGLRDYTSALQSHQRALAIRRKIFVDNHPDTASSYNNNGATQHVLGDYTSALQSHQRALAIRRKIFGDNHPDTASSYNNIGCAQKALGDYTSAFQPHQRALAIRREIFGDNHPDTASSYNSIVDIQIGLQSFLAIAREAIEYIHSMTAGSYNNIGNTQNAMEDYTSSLQSHQKALAITREIFGDNHPDTASSYNNIGATQNAMGDFNLALQSFQQALNIQCEIFGDNHPRTATIYNNIGSTQNALGNYTSAHRSYQRALKIQREIFGDNHPYTATIYNNIGNTQNALGDYTSALQSHRRALEVQRKMFGDNHQHTAGSYNNIGTTQSALGNYSFALQSYQRALEINLKIFGNLHPDTASSYNNIGNTQNAMGDYTSSLQSHLRALAIRQTIFGNNHPDTASSYNNIGATQNAKGDFPLALHLFQRALKIQREIFGDNHPHIATIYNNIGSTQNALENCTSAHRSHQRALEIQREMFGDHPYTATSYIVRLGPHKTRWERLLQFFGPTSEHFKYNLKYLGIATETLHSGAIITLGTHKTLWETILQVFSHTSKHLQ